MAQQTTTEARTALQTPEDDAAQVKVALSAENPNRDHPAVERGEPIADHPAADDGAYVEGHVAARYSDTKYMVETELGYQIVVDKKDGHDAVARDFETGEELGRPVYQEVTSDEDLPEDTEDWDSDDWAQHNGHPDEANHYVSTTGNITRHCPACGYEGTHDHPRRSAPTFHADLTHHCPDAECGRRLHSGPAAECEDCDHEDDEDDEDEGAEVATDGGVVVQDGGSQPTENPHEHAGVWGAAANLEAHEDGSAPRIGVEYRKKNGNGTARKAGTVTQVEVERPDDTWGEGVEQPTPRIVFQRDDGQRMYVEPDGLYTVGSHAPYVGAVVALTTSTTSTLEVPEGDSSQEQGDTSEDDDAGQATRAARTPDWRQAAAENQPEYSGLGAGLAHALAEWAEGQDGLHGEVGTTCYSWDIPGFGKQNDPHSGRTAKEGGDCVYVEVRGPRSEAQEKALAQVCHEFDVEASTSSHRATLVPPQGL